MLDEKVQILDEDNFLPDAIVWFTGRDRPATLEHLFDTVCKTLGYDYLIRLPLDEKREGVFRLLRIQSCLLMIDNLNSYN